MCVTSVFSGEAKKSNLTRSLLFHHLLSPHTLTHTHTHTHTLSLSLFSFLTSLCLSPLIHVFHFSLSPLSHCHFFSPSPSLLSASHTHTHTHTHTLCHCCLPSCEYQWILWRRSGRGSSREGGRASMLIWWKFLELDFSVRASPLKLLFTSTGSASC